MNMTLNLQEKQQIRKCEKLWSVNFLHSFLKKGLFIKIVAVQFSVNQLIVAALHDIFQMAADVFIKNLPSLCLEKQSGVK